MLNNMAVVVLHETTGQNVRGGDGIHPLRGAFGKVDVTHLAR